VNSWWEIFWRFHRERDNVLWQKIVGSIEQACKSISLSNLINKLPSDGKCYFRFNYSSLISWSFFLLHLQDSFKKMTRFFLVIKRRINNLICRSINGEIIPITVNLVGFIENKSCISFPRLYFRKAFHLCKSDWLV